MVVDVSLDQEFDYAVPDNLRTTLQVGSQVQVPFGRRKARGFIVGFREKSAFGTLKAVETVVDAKPLILPPVMELAQWMARYYACPIEASLKTVLPSAVRGGNTTFKKQRNET